MPRVKAQGTKSFYLGVESNKCSKGGPKCTLHSLPVIIMRLVLYLLENTLPLIVSLYTDIMMSVLLTIL